MHEGDWNEYRHDRQRGRGDRKTNLVCAGVRCREVILAHLDVSHDVFPDHYRIVYQNSDGERKPEQRHGVESEPERVDSDERRDRRNRQRESGDHGRAPGVEKEEDDDNRQDRSDHERIFNVAHGVAHPRTGVAHNVELHAEGQCLSYLVNARIDLITHACRTGALGFGDVDTDPFDPVEESQRPLFC